MVRHLHGGPTPRVEEANGEDAPDDAQPAPIENDEMQSRRQAYRDTSSHRVGPSAERASRMTMRRTTGTGTEAYQRFAQRAEAAQAALSDRMEEQGDRTRDGFDRIFAMLEDIRADIRRGEQTAHTMENRLSDLELQVNMTRDEVQRSQSTAPAGRVVAARAAISDAAKSPLGKLAAFALAILALVSFLEALPKITKGAETVWVFVRDYGQSPPPKADETSAGQ